ncbi:hypothetical protein [Bradyrhizobium elkanii]|uniref:hypothetical protein n=1 Tax=Bradyrhizobium elkanii TaxID=29448 RepID=UPI0021676600|nr:hypothetical protein [Bradyrhizobium elkanii]MCS3519274.1 hypothetical protein [Bradyrhizobium elkanii]MCS4066931.1 hypothetical protein [Bradyrhizobium elkanii]MCS4082466.1 hypothetical protein [Bradyrhizobium elkanii]MCW2127915.1 hypothetical protein [Bradyrhizobium elkanii]MCW2174658.1 hypothetical protein [Bradyrhizobium elkanii]
MHEKRGIEVFQDLTIVGPQSKRGELREALIKTAAAPWKQALDAEHDLRRMSRGDDIIVFQREADSRLPAAGLTLWSRASGYEITNIVPKTVGQLTYAQYNGLLQEFERSIAKPAATIVGFVVEVSAPRQTLEEWVSPEVARALEGFSHLANKSTGSSHPSDQARWLRFLILSYRSAKKLDSDLLRRWLVEVDGWDEDHAFKLVVEYEFGLDLLTAYDRQR